MNISDRYHDMDIERVPKRPYGLAECLVTEAIMDETSIRKAIENAKGQNISLVKYLIQHKLVAPHLLAHYTALTYGLLLFDLNALEPKLIPYNFIIPSFSQQHQCLPIYIVNDHLYVALSDPANVSSLTTIQFNSGLTTHALLVEYDKLDKLMTATLNKIGANILNNISPHKLINDTNINEKIDQYKIPNKADENDAPIVQFVNNIILEAIQKNASDIHFEPYQNSFRVRFRIDGILYEIANPPSGFANRICTRIKVLANLDIAERRLPQDGRFKMQIQKQKTSDFRVSTCPTIIGEKIVLRILNTDTSLFNIAQLGMEVDQQQLFLQHIKKPQGMVLVTGPTGSGKTITLYAGLNFLNTNELNISSVEEPVEIKLAGINQVNVNPKIGLNFATILRTFLRQDPDVIMVGEMRDLETAEIAIKAAQTGHMVFSTLHTNNAIESLTRLENIGVPRYNIATSISLIIAQRLVRRLCNHCKGTIHLPSKFFNSAGFHQVKLDTIKCYQAVGCDQCTNGYNGRTAIYEMLPISEAISQLILDGASTLEIATAAYSNGLYNLRDAGLYKIARGITSLDEVNRIVKD